ncbi:DUF3253 domain-containing protein [bacterium]|nr:DUF3253 domain-containing protein [bacterium]
MTWRRAWSRTWDSVSTCSDACRKRRRSLARQGRTLEEAILRLLSDRGASATICPSEAARAVGGEAWRDLMEPAREAARRLVARGEVAIVQGGRTVDPSSARGPVRIRLERSGGSR